MPEFKKKVCLIGSFAVGKTSLIRRFVSGVFSDEYLTTLGVKVDQKTVTLEGREVLLLVWDLAGSDQFAKVQQAYLAGSSGFLFVADGTRKSTLDDVVEEAEGILKLFPVVSISFLINKVDLAEEWEVTEERISELKERYPVRLTSALTGDEVEETFLSLAREMVEVSR